MASFANLCVRSGSSLAKASQVVATASRTVSVSASRTKRYTTNDPVEHATGLEKYELLAKKAGNDDPFFMNATPRGKGTKDDPNIVDAMSNYRMIGCVCEEGDTAIKWMWVFEGQPTRCGCGHWFKLRRHEPLRPETLPL